MLNVVKSFGVILLAVAVLGGGTLAFFTAQDTIGGNTASAADVTIGFQAVGDNGGDATAKPMSAPDLIPGQFSDWFRARLDNQNTGADVPLRYFMYVDNLQPNDLCPLLNIEIRTGEQATGGDPDSERDRLVYEGDLLGIAGDANRIELTGNPPFEDNVANNGEMQFVQQRVQLDENADNGSQGDTCTWDEIFVAETAAPDDETEPTE